MNLSKLSYKNTPTLDKYFRQPLRDLIAPRWGTYKDQLAVYSMIQPIIRPNIRPITRIGPNCFVANERAVIIRYATPDELQKIRELSVDRCYYLIDDDLTALEHDTSLPIDYRDRLTAFKNNVLPKILDLADSVVAPNSIIHRAYPDHEALLVGPSYTALCQDFNHFDAPASIKIVFSGTRSHLADLELIAKPVTEILARHAHVTFTTYLGKYAPKNLQDCQRVIHHKPQSWAAFRKILKNERFHIACAPHRDSAFNRARSLNKMLDHAAFGAAGIYSDIAPLNAEIQNNHDGVLVGGDPENWIAAIENLIQQQGKARSIAEAGVNRAQTIGNPSNIRAFWCPQLGLVEPLKK